MVAPGQPFSMNHSFERHCLQPKGVSFGPEKLGDRLRGGGCAPPRAAPAALTSVALAATRFMVRVQVHSKQWLSGKPERKGLGRE